MTPSPRTVAVFALVACSHRTAQDAALSASTTVAPIPTPAPLVEPECRADRDCAPTTCCGPSAPDECATLANAARNCEVVECQRPATLRCACRAGRCAAVR